MDAAEDVDLEAQFAALMAEDADATAETLSSAAHSVSSPVSDGAPVLRGTAQASDTDQEACRAAASDTDENTTVASSSEHMASDTDEYTTSVSSVLTDVRQRRDSAVVGAASDTDEALSSSETDTDTVSDKAVSPVSSTAWRTLGPEEGGGRQFRVHSGLAPARLSLHAECMRIEHDDSGDAIEISYADIRSWRTAGDEVTLELAEEPALELRCKQAVLLSDDVGSFSARAHAVAAKREAESKLATAEAALDSLRQQAADAAAAAEQSAQELRALKEWQVRDFAEREDERDALTSQFTALEAENARLRSQSGVAPAAGSGIRAAQMEEMRAVLADAAGMIQGQPGGDSAAEAEALAMKEQSLAALQQVHAQLEGLEAGAAASSEMAGMMDPTAEPPGADEAMRTQLAAAELTIQKLREDFTEMQVEHEVLLQKLQAENSAQALELSTLQTRAMRAEDEKEEAVRRAATLAEDLRLETLRSARMSPHTSKLRPAAKAAEEVVCVFTERGSLGLKLNPDEAHGGAPLVVKINPDTQAMRHKQLRTGLLMRRVGGTDLAGMAYGSVLELLRTVARPTTITFVDSAAVDSQLDGQDDAADPQAELMVTVASLEAQLVSTNRELSAMTAACEEAERKQQEAVDALLAMRQEQKQAVTMPEPEPEPEPEPMTDADVEAELREALKSVVPEPTSPRSEPEPEPQPEPEPEPEPGAELRFQATLELLEEERRKSRQMELAVGTLKAQLEEHLAARRVADALQGEVLSTARDELTSATAARDALAAELSAKEGALEAAALATAEASAAVSSAQADASQARATLEAEREDHAATVASLERRLEEKHAAQDASAAAEMDALKSKVRLAEQRLDRVARHTSSLLSSARAEEKAAFATEKRALAARLQAQEQKLEGLLAVRVPSLQSAVETSNVSRTAAEEVLQLELERQAEEIARLSQSLAAAEERLAAVPALQTALTEASRETDELRSTHKAQHIETQREHAAVLAERESLASATVQETAARMSQVLTDASAAQASLTSEMAALQARYTALEAAESAAVAENGRVSAALATRTRELAEKSEAARRVGALLRTAVDEKEARETVLVRQRSAAITECEALITRLKQQHAVQLAEANGRSAAEQNARLQEQDAARAQLGSAQATMRTLSSERDLAVTALERRDALHAQERDQMLGRLQQSRELTDEAEAEAEVAARQLYDLGTELSDARAEGNRNADSIRVEMLQSETRLRSLLVASQREGKKWAADATWLEYTIAAKEGEAESRVLRAEKRAADAESRLQQYLGASTELIKPLLRQGKQVQRALAEQSAARGDGSGLWLWVPEDSSSGAVSEPSVRQTPLKLDPVGDDPLEEGVEEGVPGLQGLVIDSPVAEEEEEPGPAQIQQPDTVV